MRGAAPPQGAPTGAPPPAAAAAQPHALVVLTRVDCSLCEQMLTELAALGRRIALPPLQLLDVDADPQLRRRYGLKVPVLLLAGSFVCSGRLDEVELGAALAALPAKHEAAGVSPGQAGPAGRTR